WASPATAARPSSASGARRWGRRTSAGGAGMALPPLGGPGGVWPEALPPLVLRRGGHRRRRGLRGRGGNGPALGRGEDTGGPREAELVEAQAQLPAVAEQDRVSVDWRAPGLGRLDPDLVVEPTRVWRVVLGREDATSDLWRVCQGVGE